MRSLVPQWPWQSQWQRLPLQSEISQISAVRMRCITSSTNRPPPVRQPKKRVPKLSPTKKPLVSLPVGFPVGDDFKEWLKSDILDGQVAQDVAPETEDGLADDIEKRLREMRLSKEKGRTILIINLVSPSLAESDFYRIANQGRHVYGWAVGLSKGMSPLLVEPKTQLRKGCSRASPSPRHQGT